MLISENKLRRMVVRSICEVVGSNFTVVGMIENSDIEYATGDFYILVDSDFINDTELQDIRKHTVITKDKFGKDSNYLGYFPISVIKKFGKILPEFKNSPIDNAIFGIPTSLKQNYITELMKSIMVLGGNAILRHNSNKKINDGFIKVGMPMNTYSKSDFSLDSTPRAYFWGTNFGKDVSNQSDYEYICELPLDKIYPWQYNPDNFKTISDVKKSGYLAVAYYMGGDKKNGTVVASFYSVPIKEIRSNRDYSNVYNSKWELIKS